MTEIRNNKTGNPIQLSSPKPLPAMKKYCPMNLSHISLLYASEAVRPKSLRKV